jgi:hypothetical protein
MMHVQLQEGDSVSRKIVEVLVDKFKEVALTVGLLPGMAVVRVSEEY